MNVLTEIEKEVKGILDFFFFLSIYWLAQKLIENTD